MSARIKRHTAVAALLGLLAAVGAAGRIGAQQRTGQSSVVIDRDDIGGTVVGAKGPEAGVWVVAETSDLPTKFARIVVTDAQGRYVVPDLPSASYTLWVRGYGLVDSPRVMAKPGQTVDLRAVVAPSARQAAEVYPANYWLGLIKVPPGERPADEIAFEVKDCITCHQLGNKATREIAKTLGTFPSSLAAWDHRTQVGPVAPMMSGFWKRLGGQRTMFADWSDRIAAGEFPKDAPPRPAGIERNLVVTLWDWGSPLMYVHDEAASDRRTSMPGAADGLVYGAVMSHDSLLWLDPATHRTGEITVPRRDPPSGRGFGSGGLQPSPVWGAEGLWSAAGMPRNAAVDQSGRVWSSVAIRDAKKVPPFCTGGSTNRFAQYFPVTSGSKQLAFYDPRSKQWTLVDTCFPTERIRFGTGPDNSIYSGGTSYTSNDVIGWVDTQVLDKTRDEQAAQGWCPAVLDTNGDGRITKPWTEPKEAIDPSRDHRIIFGCYSATVNPVDGSMWCSPASINGLGTTVAGNHGNNKLVRIERGANPPQTCRAEAYLPPADSGLIAAGGIDIDSSGVVWVNWRGTDFVSSFDRRKCKVLNGPSATGDHCREGWTAYPQPKGPLFQGTTLNADLLYLIHVDKHDALGLGKDVPTTIAVNSDALLALRPDTRQYVTLRIPYPLAGLVGRTSHGRIDDPKAGWKGRGLWTSMSTYAPWHMEGGKGTKSKVVKFQFRPDPTAK
jgi:hypothetical protein